ncbi:hypothetical protein [Chromobacterium haemolyticum]|uniref:hypothetical protein n=1 Tax=Chromobacterium haemolyticum TaxID=394935 RepID=UPI001318271A|nr:hypothetical protein [Chromobacterium haemolyticum]BBH12907.1 hypothetical protein CH06BL_21550 [Chromobacterium haemolyticum]
MADYTQERDDATRQIREDGGPVVLRVSLGQNYVPGKGMVSRWQDFDSFAVFSDFGFVASGQTFAPGSTIQVGDKKALFAVCDATPAPGHLLVVKPKPGDEEDVWRVVNIKSIQPEPGGVFVMHTLQLRR